MKTCPHCKSLMRKVYTNITTNRELWKCDCGYREMIDAKEKDNNSEGEGSSKA